MQVDNSLAIQKLLETNKQLLKEVERLREENQSLKNIIELTPGYLYWKNLDQVYLGCNRGIAERIGLAKCEDIVGHTLSEFLSNGISQEAANAVNRIDAEIMTHNKLYEIEEVGFEGKTFITKKRPLYNSKNEVVGLLGISLDISDRKKMEEELREAKEKAEAANRAKSLFLGNMSHDIRTPLNGILGFAQLLEMEEKDPAKKEKLALILKSGRKLLGLLSEIIDIAYIENGMPIKYEKVDLREIIKEVYELMQVEIKQKNLQFIINLDSQLPPTFKSDKLRIHRILLNLIGNAVKFTHTGYIKISGLVSKNRNGAYLEIIIEDSGIGFPKEEVDNIFQNFTRLTPSDQSLYQGSGLGLYIVKTFINELKGSVTATSQVNLGSKFICKLPLE
ncbi:MAG: putative sensory histidine-kinase / response regulator [Gammaproteobacteria bacterium]|jgi:PAS domain S-box-containing protein|nr:putative sensory histidine-kinase / response regulator [Gammaproteobacteria bacterium]